MPNGANRPRMPEGVNVFREIGVGAGAGAGAPGAPRPEVPGAPRPEAPGAEGELQDIIRALQSGDTSQLVRARQMLNDLVTRRTQRPDQPAAPPTPAPGAAVARQATERRAAPAAPAQPARPEQPVRAGGAPPAAPAAPGAPGAQAQSPNVLSDLVRLINAASKIGSPSGDLTARAQPQNPLMAGAGTPGRRPM